MTAQRFPSDRLRLPGERSRTGWLDVAAPMLRFLFWAGLVLLPFVVLMCDYGTQP